MRSLSCAFLVVLVACGGSKQSSVDAPVVDSALIDTAIDAPDPRGPKTIELTGGANGLLWDASASKLYLTDNNTNTLLSYTDAAGVQTVGSWPTGGMISLGDLVKRSDGSILVANFGFGTTGTIFSMAANGTSSAYTVTDATRRRIGLAQDSAGQLYVAYFVGGGMMMQTGGVASVTLGGTTATETEIAGGATSAGFKKVVGLAATTDAIYVADQTENTIFKIAIPGNAVTTHASSLPSADLLTLMPNGDLLTGGTGVHRITPTGAVTTILGGFEQVRGLAYDNTLKRLFIIEHSATPGTPDKLHIRPLDN